MLSVSKMTNLRHGTRVLMTRRPNVTEKNNCTEFAQISFIYKRTRMITTLQPHDSGRDII